MKKCIILANGKSPKKKRILLYINRGYDLICADGGANSAYKLEILPDFIIGDLDSIKPKVRKFFKKYSTIIEELDQNLTDVQKALNLAYKYSYKKVVIMGIEGDRIDHLLYNLHLAYKYSDILDIKLIYNKSKIRILKDRVSLDIKKGKSISLFSFDTNVRVTSEGLKYPLKNTSLKFGITQSISNETTKDIVSLHVENGKIIFIEN